MAIHAPAVTTLLFDIHGVFFLDSEERFAEIAADARVTSDELRDALYRNGIWEDYKRGRCSEAEYWQSVCGHLPAASPAAPDWLRRRMDGTIDVDRALAAFVATLRPRFRVAALSNAGAELERRLKQHGILGIFECIMNSHRLGMAKPEEQVYAHAANRLVVDPREVLFIDDKERNTAVAAGMGFQTHVYADLTQFADAARRL